MPLFLFQIFLWVLWLSFGNTFAMTIHPRAQLHSTSKERATDLIAQLPQPNNDHSIFNESAAWNVSNWVPTEHDALRPLANHCGPSTFIDQTSNASPFANHCLQIVRNIQGDKKTSWRIAVGRHRTIASHATCHFGVESNGGGNNIFFDVGGEDVEDLIRDSVRKFRRSNGRIGAKGVMSCSGSFGREEVLWGIF